MKKLSLVIFYLLFYHLTAVSQSCLPQGITFTTQTEIDNFQANYPNCTQIEGNVFIGGGSNNITNLNGLSVLTSFGGDLHISSMSLTSLTGLNAVSFIGGKLMINDSPLTDLTGLNALTTIGGDFQIIYMNGLISLAGLEALTTVGGALSIAAYSLSSLSGLSSLTSIGGVLELGPNYAMTSFSGLEALTSVGGRILIQANHTLTSLSGLDNIESSSIDTLSITYNSDLTICAIQSICDYLANPGGIIEINNNAAGCNSQAEVDSACALLFVENYNYDDGWLIYPNPTSDKLTIEIPEITVKRQMTIMNLHSQELINRPMTGRKTEIDISALPKGAYFIRLTSERTLEVKKIIKQ